MDSNNSRKIMTINSFTEEPNHITTSVIAEIDVFQKMGPDDVVIDGEDLLPHIRQQVFPDGYPVEPNPINVVAGLGPMFSKLPREIRDMIFGEMLASGQPQVLRASKIMNQEGSSLISKHGVYRTNISFGTCPTISQQVADLVQNLQLRVHMNDFVCFGLLRYRERNIYKMLSMFSMSNVSRKSCSVVFEGHSASDGLIALEVVYSMRWLKEFEQVTLSIDSAWFDEEIDPDHWAAGFMNGAYKSGHLSLDIACFELEQHLGTAYRVEEKLGPQLVLYPRCSGRGVVKDSAGKEKRKWVKWGYRKEDTAM